MVVKVRLVLGQKRSRSTVLAENNRNLKGRDSYGVHESIPRRLAMVVLPPFQACVLIHTSFLKDNVLARSVLMHVMGKRSW